MTESGRLLVILLAVAAALSGCFGADAPPESGDDVTAAGAEGDVSSSGADAARAPGPSASGSSPDPMAGTTPARPPRALPVLLDGNTGTFAFVCAAATHQCHGTAAVPGESDLMMDDLAGRIIGGSLALTWTASSPATQELSMGAMLMSSECDAIDLGSVVGPSPLALEVAGADRALCDAEVVHVWVSGSMNGGSDLYYQVDVDQEFHLEGALLLLPP